MYANMHAKKEKGHARKLSRDVDKVRSFRNPGSLDVVPKMPSFKPSMHVGVKILYLHCTKLFSKTKVFLF